MDDKERRRKMIEATEKEQENLLRELREVGIDVRSVDLLPDPSPYYEAALPILARHIQMPYSPVTLEWIARAMENRLAGKYWDLLVSLYRTQSVPDAASWGNFPMALSAAVAAAMPANRLRDLIQLINDDSLAYRTLLLAPLRKRRNTHPGVRELLLQLSVDPNFSKEIRAWKWPEGTEFPMKH